MWAKAVLTATAVTVALVLRSSGDHPTTSQVTAGIPQYHPGHDASAGRDGAPAASVSGLRPESD
ncbi:hypothetical protein [Streptomyces sp. NBC_00829]|uniref:hypothetical protein n=1 Tax=Streptomyces sp. NBC_00829 TaxID=2903679 RepID=UPI00386947FE|nr:hypothetical protein OG293_07080 [Streptomyces sp. NBC_00829]